MLRGSITIRIVGISFKLSIIKNIYMLKELFLLDLVSDAVLCR